MGKQSAPQHGALLRPFILLLFVALSASALSAQDHIILKNGNTMEAKVTEIQSAGIKYKRVDNLNGPVYALPKSEVFMILYENGTKEVINDLSAPTATTPQRVARPAAAPSRQTQQPSYQHWMSDDQHRNSVFGGVSIPLINDATKMGFFAGYEHLVLFTEQFGLTSHFSVSYNKLQSYYYDYYNLVTYTFKGGDFNTRLMAGPSFQMGSRTGVTFYGSGLIGANFIFFTGDFSPTPKTISFAYGSSLGVVFNDKIDVGVRFISHTALTATPSLYVSAGYRF